MNENHKKDYITYRVVKSEESLKAAQLMAENQLWTSSINRLYYSCFYIVDALLFYNKIKAKSHTGAKSQFTLHFIKTGKVNIEFGELYTDLLDLRQEGDYGSKFEIGAKEIKSYIQEVQHFISVIKTLLPEPENPQ